MRHVDGEIARLQSAGVLSPAQADQLRRAVELDENDHPEDGRFEADQHAPPVAEPAGANASAMLPAQRSAAVLEVLGYVGGALLLGAIVFLGVYFWDDLDRTGRNLVAVASLVISLAGGIALSRYGVRRDVGHVLIALGCYAAGFTWFNLFSDDKFIASSAVIAVASTAAVLLLRSGAPVFSGWSGLMLLVLTAVLDLDPEFANGERTALFLGIGFALVALVLALCGFALSRALAWSLAGVSGWAASLAWLGRPQNGEWLALATATVFAALLLWAFVRTHFYALAVFGCLILLTMWPTCLQEIFESPIGVATGLIAAGGVLIGVVVLMSRRRSRQPAPATPT